MSSPTAAACVAKHLTRGRLIERVRSPICRIDSNRRSAPQRPFQRCIPDLKAHLDVTLAAPRFRPRRGQILVQGRRGSDPLSAKSAIMQIEACAGFSWKSS